MFLYDAALWSAYNADTISKLAACQLVDHWLLKKDSISFFNHLSTLPCKIFVCAKIAVPGN